MRQYYFITLLLFLLTCTARNAAANTVIDSCIVNDVCDNAIGVVLPPTDSEFVCITGCTNGAFGESAGLSCPMEIYPTVWYQVETDSFAQFLNVQLRSDDMLTPVIGVYERITDCADRKPVSVCQKGNHGEIDVLGISVIPGSTYFIAVTAFYADTGQFELCLNTVSTNNICVVRRSIEVVSRSLGGTLTGPFLPGETVRICMVVDSFTAQYNGCQWFQGIVPSFGSGWLPTSFDSVGQPMNATINGFAIGVSGNGLYGNAANPVTWDWFTDVDYHFARPFLKLGDFDGNNTVEICNSHYNSYCDGGAELMQAACCRPCWDDTLGTILPGGWYAYGINGVCAKRGPPIKYDWGDGASCGGGMGPWRFCFDLQVRDDAECGPNSTTDDLSLSFATIADGDIGTWTGSASICAFDQPATTRLPLLCAPTKRLNDEVLPNLCDGLGINYLLYHDDVTHWTWSASPTDVVRTTTYEADNGHVIIDHFGINVDTPVQVNYTFIGEQSGTDTLLIKNVSFYVLPQINIDLPEVIYVCKKERRPLIVRPIITGGDSATMDFTWGPYPGDADTLVIQPPFQAGIVHFAVGDEVGCYNTASVEINLRPCIGGPNPPTDDNDLPIPQDPLPPGRHFTDEEADIAWREMLDVSFTVQPIPARDEVIIVTEYTMSPGDRLVITDLRGVTVASITNEQFNDGKAIVGISAWPEGLYFATLLTSHGTMTVRIAKM
jgi:hypothetical protein